MPKPKAKGFLLFSFLDIPAACEFVPTLFQEQPSAIELIPKSLLLRASNISGFSNALNFGKPGSKAYLLAEFNGKTVEEIRDRISHLALIGSILNHEEYLIFQAIRKIGFNLLKRDPGNLKPTQFIEDVAIPIDKMPDYVRRVNHVLNCNNTTGEWYGHASVGCLHINPELDLKNPQDLIRKRNIAEEVFDIVKDMQGVVSGEHGDGEIRTEFTSKIFGKEITQAFRELKHSFDPYGILNPGKVISSPDNKFTLESNLKFGAVNNRKHPPTTFTFHREKDILHAVEFRVGSGECLTDQGIMCPSYHVTHEMFHSPRGRANILRSVLSGGLSSVELPDHQIYDLLDLCLECKACKYESSTAVDIAKIKAQFLEYYFSKHRIPIRNHLFAEIARFSKAARPFVPLINLLINISMARWSAEKVLGIARKRQIPTFAYRTFRDYFDNRPVTPREKQVLLFVDTYTNYYFPDIGIAAVQVLEYLNYEVILSNEQVCCGRPMISKGLLEKAKALARTNIDVLIPFVHNGIKIIGLEPSCILTLRDEYLDFYPHDSRAKDLANSCYLIEEFLMQKNGRGECPIEKISFHKSDAPIYLHSHCYTKALSTSKPMIELLRLISLEVFEVGNCCC